MSDTATDILVNAQPLDKITTTWAKTRPRRGSLGSDGSDFSDIDEQLTSAMRKRSKSADGRGEYKLYCFNPLPDDKF